MGSRVESISREKEGEWNGRRRTAVLASAELAGRPFSLPARLNAACRRLVAGGFQTYVSVI